ncbi:MAG: hypothetical protein E6H10_16665 [Bacteroidetes bacterium]|nr:MAG: hypothetical protein E6H10_16665 [Bacteroidota bacterium]
MRKYLLLIFLVTCYHPIWSQWFLNEEQRLERRNDSLRLERIKKQLSYLHGREQIDSLNLLSEMYEDFAPAGGFVYSADSMYACAAEANHKATALGYEAGMILSLALMAKGELLKGDVNASEALIKRALSYGNSSSNFTAIGRAYWVLSEVRIRQNDDFREVVECLKKAIYYYHLGGDLPAEAELYEWLCTGCTDKGDYEDAFDYCQKGMTLVKTPPHTPRKVKELRDLLYDMGRLYAHAKDYETALYYWRQVHLDEKLGVIFQGMGQLDSSIFYFQKTNSSDPVTKIESAYTYILKKDYKVAMKLLLDGFNMLKSEPESFRAPAFIALGGGYFETKKYDSSLKYATKGVELVEKYNSRPDMMGGYELLSKLYHQLGNDKKAYLFQKKYIVLKDSLLNRQFLWRLYANRKVADDEKRQSQIALLQRDNKIKAQQLQQESIVKTVLVGGLLLILVVAIFIIRNLRLKRKNMELQKEKTEDQLRVQQLHNEKRYAEFQQQAVKLEMQALKAQMNPHFIFNCLSSINWLIMEKNTEGASAYLTKFSKLIRMVLINSEKPVVLLDTELEMLRLYLDMESLRFEGSFDYEIHCANDTASSVSLPPLLLQPFCENAIWHGLLHKDGKGKLTINISQEDNILCCTVTDNGVGRKAAAELNRDRENTHKSMGLKITKNRLALFNEKKREQGFFEMEDLVDENGAPVGTKAIINIKSQLLPQESFD